MKHFSQTKKIIGVLGLSPYATIDFLRKLADVTPAKKDWEHLRVIMDLNTAIPSRGRALDLGEEDPTSYMKEAIKRIAKNGANIIVVPCNTAHIFYSRFTEGIDIKVLNIIEETSNYILAKNSCIKKVGVIASKNTVKSELYNKFLSKNTVEVIAPENQAEVSAIIENVKIGLDNEETKNRAIKVAQGLIERGAEGIILGCTEIPLLIGDDDLSVPSFDSNKILAQACVRLSQMKNG